MQTFLNWNLTGNHRAWNMSWNWGNESFHLLLILDIEVRKLFPSLLTVQYGKTGGIFQASILGWEDEEEEFFEDEDFIDEDDEEDLFEEDDDEEEIYEDEEYDDLEEEDLEDDYEELEVDFDEDDDDEF